MKTTNHSGYILPIVLFLVILLTTGALFTLHISKQKILHSEELINHVEAQLEAESQLEIIKYYCASGRFTQNRIDNSSLNDDLLNYPKSLFLDNREQNLSDTALIQLQDTAGLLNAMFPEPKTLSSLLSAYSSFDRPETFYDSIIDWYDQDDFHRLNGAEENYYRSLNVGYKPRNMPVSQSVDEIRLIRGIRDLNEKEWNYLRGFFVFSPATAFNYLTAPTQLLAAKLNLPEKELEGLIELRNKDPFEFSQRLRLVSSKFNPETIDAFPSKVVLVNITIRKNKTNAKITAVLDCNDRKNIPLRSISRY